MRVWISFRFLFPKVSVYLCNLPYVHVWSTAHIRAGATSCYFELLEKLQKRICRTAGTSLAASLKPLAHRRNVATLSLSASITLVDVLQNWLNWFHFLFLNGGQPVILIDCMIFLSPRCYKDLNSFFLWLECLGIWNSFIWPII